eukprot:scaffold14652_cov30-Prasinocladus_malaysianus.AAC.1
MASGIWVQNQEKMPQPAAVNTRQCRGNTTVKVRRKRQNVETRCSPSRLRKRRAELKLHVLSKAPLVMAQADRAAARALAPVGPISFSAMSQVVQCLYPHWHLSAVCPTH